MEKKYIFLIMFGLLMYDYLIDVFNNPEFSGKASYIIGRKTNNKSHTIVEYIKSSVEILMNMKGDDKR